MASSTAGELAPLTLHIAGDVIDMLEDLIPREDDDRLERQKALEDFWKILGDQAPTSGPQFIRYRLAKVFAAVCHCDPYDENAYNAAVEEEKRIKAHNVAAKENPRAKLEPIKSTLLAPAYPLAAWKRCHWKDLEGVLAAVKDEMLLKVNRAGNEDEEVDDDEVDEEAAGLPLYNAKLDKAFDYIALQKCIAEIRWQLEQQVEKNIQGNTPVKIDAEKLANFAQDVEDLPEGRVKEVLELLLTREATSRKTRLSGLAFAPPQTLKDVLQGKALNLYNFQEIIKKLLAQWQSNTLGKDSLIDQSVLTQQGYRGDDRDQYIYSLTAAASAAGANDIHDDDDEEESVAGGQKENQSPPAAGGRKRVLEVQDADDNVLARKPASKRAKKAPASPAPPADPSVTNLRQMRANLRNEGTDPLAEAEALASTAAAAPPAAAAAARRDRDPNAKKPSAQQLAFESSDDEEDDDDEKIELSAVPERARVKSTRKASKYVVREKNDAGSTKRIRWQEWETKALLQGLAKHGGSEQTWCSIKSDPEFTIALARRTGQNLKDRVVTLKNQGVKLPGSYGK